jgi:Tfp pilus assembly protein PilX
MQKKNKENKRMASLRIQSNDRGVALVAVMLTLLLITAIAAGIIILTNTETNTSSNFKDEQRAFFSAKSGIEEARDRLRKNIASYTITRPTTTPGSGATGVLYILNALNGETVAPWCASATNTTTCMYADDELCNEQVSGTSITCAIPSGGTKNLPSGSYYQTVNASSTLAPASGSVLDWKWTRVTLKQNNSFGSGYYVNGSSSTSSQVYWNGTNECITGVAPCNLPVYVLTSLAVTPSGSRRMVQMEVAEDQLSFNAPAALTLDGNGDSFSGGDSANYSVLGTDQGGCGAPSGAAVPAVGVTDPTDATNVSNAIVANVGTSKATNYAGSGSTTPDVENISTGANSANYVMDKLDSVTDLQSLVSTLKNDVTQPVMNCQSGCSSLSNSGTSSNPQIIYVNGDLTLSGNDPNPSKNNDGYGILVVTGNLTVKGTVAWDGLVLVIGKGNLQMDGTNNFTGAVVVAKTVDSLGNLLTTPQPGTATVGVNGGGNANGGIWYSSSCLAQATQLSTFHSVSFRELMN